MIAGEHRDDLVGLVGPLDDGLLLERADEAFIRTLSTSAGPDWLAGEHLPRRRQGEVELARVALASVTSDVIALRGRWAGGRYHYRMVDEYGTDIELCRETSRRPLTLGQVSEILETVEGGIETDGKGIVACWWGQQFRCGYSPDDGTNVAWLESELYPDLPGWYASHARARGRASATVGTP